MKVRIHSSLALRWSLVGALAFIGCFVGERGLKADPPAAANRAFVYQMAGSVTLVRGGTAQNLAQLIARDKFVALQGADEIRTGAASAVILAFPTTRVRIAENTALVIDDLYTGSEAPRLRARLTRGAVATEVDRGTNSQVSIAGPTAIAGVRGTQFIVETSGAGDAATTSVLVNEGEVGVTSPASPTEIAIAAGQKAICDAQGTRTAILEQFEKDKFRIFEEFRRVRQEAQDAVNRQRQEARDALDEIRRNRPNVSPNPTPAPESTPEDGPTPPPAP